ncbi:MAG: hypothetical protein JXA37_12265 [Chloroflexia bacterium]|nr:hypothetical protein [Chloroflexia bacterium]
MQRSQRCLVPLMMIFLLGGGLLLSCTTANGSVPLYELLAHPSGYAGEEVNVLGFYYQGGERQLLVVGVRTDDGFQNPLPLGEALWVEGMPDKVLLQLNLASGVYYGMVQVQGRFETGGGFGPDGSYPSRLLIDQPDDIVALEAAQMEQAWVPPDVQVAGAISLEQLLHQPERYSDQTVTLVAYYYWSPQTWVLAEGIRSLDGVHNAVPIGRQVWVEGFPPDVSGDLNVLENNVHGLVQVQGRFETRGGYGPNGAYPFRLVVQAASSIGR